MINFAAFGMAYWVFVITGSVEELQSRIESKKWPIFKNTANRNKVKPDDEAIIYHGGQENKKFVGEATVNSKLQSDGDSSWIELSRAALWNKPVPMADIVTVLEFIPNKKNWGAYIQGGVVSIPRKDYKTIINKITK